MFRNFLRFSPADTLWVTQRSDDRAVLEFAWHQNIHTRADPQSIIGNMGKLS